MKIKEVIVVEGYHDMQHLKQFINADIIVTNGSAINNDIMNLIKQASQERGIIVFTDPDYPGERIRNIITKNIDNTKHAFLKKELAIDHIKHKVGIEHASKVDIIEALNNVSTFSNYQSLTWHDYLSFNINKQDIRNKICNYLKISYCNNKTLFNRLNMLNINKDKLQMIMEAINE
ncbi:MAG: ribonuclease M5 [Bacilli bacterium]|jgi:ribonuclease M5|nr:ribonuclease M5 [Bacilli bacterium]